MTTPAWYKPLYRPEAISLGGLAILTNIGTAYDTVNASKGLGLARVDFTNVLSVIFTVFINKIGAGTQSWQLWNVTDGAAIAVLDDAGATGDKTLTTTIAGASIPVGVKVVRVRAKSTTATDDPIYYGGYLELS